MKKILLSLLAVLGLVSLLPAQELTVESFEMLPTDLTAKIANRKDLNGDVCALVKIFVALPTISVPEGMRLGEVESPAPSEFRVFMPAGSRRIQINTTGYLPLRFDFPEPLATMRTYLLRLALPERAVYKVGDYYCDESGKEGIVFEVDATGLHGKIIALTDAPGEMSWDNARSYCAGLGAGWRLPTKGELLEIYRQKSLLDAALEKHGKGLGNWYWSGTEYNKRCAWDVNMYHGSTLDNLKCYHYYVRAVSAF